MDFDYKLLARYLTGGLSSEEKQELMHWCCLSAENKAIFSDIVKLRISWNYTQYKDSASVEAALAKANAGIDRMSRYSLFRTVLKYVAALLLLFSLSYAGYEYFKPEKYLEIVVGQQGDIKEVLLADGTSVWLKGPSILRIPQSFSVNHRQVILKGNAFFEVMKDKTPFYVVTEYLNIGVYGTSFELKTNDEQKEMETVLVKGKITLLDHFWKTVLDIQPGQKITYNETFNRLTTEMIDVNLCAVWRLGQTVFEDATLREIAGMLSEKFDVNIKIKSSSLEDRRFRCVLNKDESLIDVLKHLKYLAPIDYRIEGKDVFIFECQTN